jgi:uncharacterized protein (DUF2249 family)
MQAFALARFVDCPRRMSQPHPPSTVRHLDVRPLLAKGADPFTVIVRSASELGADETLHLVAPFEPKPLYAVLRSLGFSCRHEARDGAHHVLVERAAPAAVTPDAGDAGAPLQAPVELDVRGLEPPGPMIAVLEKLVELGPGAQLLVRHHKEPVLLYEKLALRGYAARAKKVCDGDFVIHVAPASAFGGAA